MSKIEAVYCDEIILNKNRGWRGLAELNVRHVTDEIDINIHSQLFSFSGDVWYDLLERGLIVIQDDDNYYVLQIDEDSRVELPHGHQRSVLIKNFHAKIIHTFQYSKRSWNDISNNDLHRTVIYNFIKNKNNHTTSEFNNVGLRVNPLAIL